MKILKMDALEPPEERGNHYLKTQCLALTKVYQCCAIGNLDKDNNFIYKRAVTWRLIGLCISTSVRAC